MELRRRFRVRVLIALTAAAPLLAAAFGVSALLMPAPAGAAQTVPYLINFQGRLTDNNGNILTDGYYNVKFRIWDDPAAGTNRWQGDRVYGGSDHRIHVVNGLFNIQFGDTSLGDPALSPSLFNSAAYPSLYLEVELPTPATADCSSNGCATWTEGAMTPRQPLASAPYAFNSDTLDGLDSSAFGQLTAIQSWTDTNTFSKSGGAAVVLSGTAASGGSILQVGSALNGGSGAGTLFGANTSSAGDLINLQVSDGLRLKVDNSGDVTTAGDITYTSGANHSLAVAPAASGAGNNLTVQAGNSGAGAFNGGNLVLEAGATGGSGTAGSVVVKANGTDTASAFVIQNANGDSVLVANTINKSLVVNDSASSGTLTIKADALNTVTQVYPAAGISSLSLPSDVATVTVKAWGAGGGGGAGSGGTGTGGNGGGGGFAQTDVPTVGGETLTIDVGSAGTKAGTNQYGGNGGGFSGVRRGSAYLAQAGAGGGGAGTVGTNAGSGGAGGAGGGPSGAFGTNGTGAAFGSGGSPGTASAGGPGGTGTGGVGSVGIANAAGDAAGTGGTCATNTGNTGYGGTGGGGRGGFAATCENGGGGGGGRYGGGGGGNPANGTNRGGGGGGGGGDLVTGINNTETAGLGRTPAGNGDPSYASCAANAGQGGAGATSIAANTDGVVGCVVVTYQTATGNANTLNVKANAGSNTFVVHSNGNSLFKTAVDTPSSFQIQNSVGSPVLTADTNGNKLAVGDSTGVNTDTTLLVIDSSTADPAKGYNGAMYYNSNLGVFRCFQGGAWINCVSTTVTATSNSQATYMASAANVLASQTGLVANTWGVTNTNAFLNTTAGMQTFPAPAAGSFRACAVTNDNVPITAGTLSLRWRVNGASVGAGACSMDQVVSRQATTALDSGIVTFSKGDLIGVALDTSAGYLPLTSDYTIYWSVEYNSTSGNGLSNQFVYDSSAGPAATNLSNGKDLVVNAADTATDPNDIINLQCVTACGANGRFAVQNGGVDVLTVAPNAGGITLATNTGFGSNTISGTGSITGGIINATTKFQANGTDGVGQTCGVNAALTNATFTGGIMTSAGSCTSVQAAGNYLVQAPAGTANTITAQSGAQALIIKGTNGTATDLLDIYDTAASPALQAYFDKDGALTLSKSLSANGGITTSNGTINTGSGSITTSGTIGGGAITGTSLATSANGTISSGSGSITSTGAVNGGTVVATTSVTSPSYTGTGAVSVSSTTAGALTLDSASANLVMGATTTAIQKAAAAFAVDLATAGTSTLTVKNTNGVNVANLIVTGNITTTTGTVTAATVNGTTGFSANGTPGTSISACGAGQYVGSFASTTGLVTGGSCSTPAGTYSFGTAGDSGSSTVASGQTVTIQGGNGLTSSDNGSRTVTLAVGAGTGISVAADTVGVDATAALSWTGIEQFNKSGGQGAIFNGTAASGAAQLQFGSVAALSSGSVNGTYIGSNPAAYTGDFLNFQINNVVKLKVDNSGNLTTSGTIGGGAITGTSLATSANGTISSGSGSITSTGAVNGGTVVATTSVTSPSYTGTGAVSVSSTTAGALTLDSASANLVMGATTTAIQKAAAAFAVDLATAGTSTLTVKNTNGVNVANLIVTGNITTTTGTVTAATVNGTTGFSANGTPGTSISACGAGQYVGSFASTTGLVTGGSCSTPAGTYSFGTAGDSGSSTVASGQTVTIQGGNGLTSSDNGSRTVTLAVGAGTGISVAADTVGVDATAALSWTGIEQFNKSGGQGAIFNGTAASGAAQLQFGSVAALSSGSVNGTYIGSNPAAYTGDFLNFQINNVVKLKVDNSGNLTTSGTIGGGAITGTSLATSANGTISSGSGSITSTGAVNGGTVVATTSVTSPSYTGTGAVSVSSTTAGALTLDSASANLVMGATTTAIQKAAAAFAVDLATAGTSTLTVKNTNGVNVANLIVTGNITTTTGTVTAATVNGTTGFSANGTPGTSISACGAGQYVGSFASTTGLVTGGSCSTPAGTYSFGTAGDSGSSTVASGQTVTIQGGNGLTSSDNGSRTVTLAVGAGTGISVAADTVGVDATAALSWTGIEQFNKSGGQGAIFNGTAASGAAQLQFGSVAALSSGSVNGTYIGSNPAAYTGDFLNFQINNVVKLKVDNSGNLTTPGTIGGGAITGTSLATSANGTISSGSGSITSTGAVNGGTVVATTSVTSPSYTGTGAVSVSSTTAGALTLDSASANLVMGATTTAIQKAAAAFAVDLATAGTSTLTVKNTNGVNVANLVVTGGVNVGTGSATAGTFSVNGSAGQSVSACGANQANTGIAYSGGIVTTGGACTTFATTTLGNIGSVAADANISPDATANNRDLGDSTHLWRTGYFNTSVITPLLTAAAGTAVNITSNNNSTWQTTGAGTLTIQSAGGSVIFGGTTPTLTTAGATALAVNPGGAAALNLGTANANAVSIGNTATATALNMSVASGGINIGDDATTKTIDIGGVTNSGTDTINIATNATAADTVYIGAAGGAAATAVVIESGTAAGKLDIGNGSTAHAIRIGAGGAAGGNAEAVTIGSNTTSTINSYVRLQGSSITTASGQSGVQIGSATTDAELVPFQLDSDSDMTADESNGSNCTTAINQGAMYYNTTTNAIRACINASWEDVISTAALGLQLLGVVPDSGAQPGDIAGATGATNGPCKVTWSAATTVNISACIAYTQGRKIIVAAQTNTSVAGNGTKYICLSTGISSGQPAVGALPAFAPATPAFCLAEVVVAANVISDIYDTRTFTTTTKAFASINSATSPGMPVVFGAAKTVITSNTAGAAKVRGVVVSTSGAASAVTVNGIIATDGIQWVRASAATAGDYVENAATGFANTAANAPAPANGAYASLGVAQTTFSTVCSTNANCEGSVLVNLNLR